MGPDRFLHHLARSGGTLVARCVGALPNVLLLSEVHPASKRFDPLRQAQDWYGLLTEKEAQALDLGRLALPFAEAIDLVRARAAARGKVLVIRDWCHGDFHGLMEFGQPTNRFATVEALPADPAPLRYASVRHPIDQWLSIRRLPELRGQLRLDQFLIGYRRFAEAIQESGFFRYEDFVADPDRLMQELCRRLALDFDPAYRERWPDNTYVTGDKLKPGRRDISAGRRPPLEPGLADQFLGHPDYRPALELLGYGHPG